MLDKRTRGFRSLEKKDLSDSLRLLVLVLSQPFPYLLGVVS